MRPSLSRAAIAAARSTSRPVSCSQAGPGEVLASQEVTHLARHLDGVEYRPRGRVTLKGLSSPVPVVELLPTQRDETRAAAFRSAVAGPRRRRRPTRALVAAGVVVVLLAGLGVYAAATRSDSPGVRSEDNRADVVDLGNGRLVDQVALRAPPSSVALGAGSLWTTNPGDGTVTRLDPDSRRVLATIPVGGEPGGVVVADGFVWVTNQSGRSVAQINPDVERVVAHVTVGNRPSGIAAGPGGVWVANTADGTVSRIDTRTGVASNPVDVGGGPTGIAATHDAVWVTNGNDGTVSLVDPRTRSERSRFPVGNGPAGITVSGGSVWVALSVDGTLARLDPDTGTVTATIPVGNGPIAVVAARESVWVSNQYGATVVRVDPRSGAVDLTVQVGGAPHGLAVADGQLWVTAAATGTSHRGGTLKVLGGLPWSIDPALDYGGQVSMITRDGLVGLRRAAGPAGTTVVPDLATSVPTPVDGGKTYAFRLRSGIRYSTGDPVRASDIRRAIERQFRVPFTPGRDFYAGIVGADSCNKKRVAAAALDDPKLVEAFDQGDQAAGQQLHSSECDLSRGIETDDATRSVTFHLTAPDPEFLYKLTLTLASAVPEGTPDRIVGTAPVPGTGPYAISRYVPGDVVELARNPHYREWSHAAQPDGYAERIVVRDRGGNAALDQVLAGQADLAYGPFPGRMPELQTRWAGQLHADSAPWFQHMMLDSTVPPFDDIRARRAVSYAVDRDRVAKLWENSTETRLQPTCQVLSPSWPGYVPYCRYPHDIAKARRLVTRSGTAGAQVTLMAHTAPIGRYLADVLESIGYRARVRASRPPPGWDFFLGYGAAPGAQMLPGGWGPDYPAPSAFFQPMLSCESADQFANSGHFCDRSLDRAMEGALALQQTQPAEAARLWRQADRIAADRAALLPLGLFDQVSVTSRRTGNYLFAPSYGVQLSELWVRPAPKETAEPSR